MLSKNILRNKKILKSLSQKCLLSTSSFNDNDVVCVSYARSHIGNFRGKFANYSAPELGAKVIKAAVDKAGISGDIIEEAIMGNVLQAGIGQAPTRQAVIFSEVGGKEGLVHTPCTTINKVCASGMKSIMLAGLSISTGYRNVMITGGMESMSNVPYYLPNSARGGLGLGNQSLSDGIIVDGLQDKYHNQHMGVCGEHCAETYSISREEQDEYAINSYNRAIAAWDAGKFNEDIVTITDKKTGEALLERDESLNFFRPDKFSNLRPVFKKADAGGTITAANASSINDGAASLIFMSGAEAKKYGCKPLFKIKGMGDAARDSVEFTIAPADAVPKALSHAGITANDVDFHEINEAFSVVSIANAKILDLDMSKVNVYGGAVAIGHPIGCSGARIVGQLYRVLKEEDGAIGCASICNGGGGASAIIIERLD